MKKIMFNDKFGLTKAVIEGRKTQTRRIVPQSVIGKYSIMEDFTIIDDARYDVGEIVAVAQSYQALGYFRDALDRSPKDWRIVRGTLGQSKGWNNKMFVRAEACKHQIRITDVRVEKLQEISEDCCLKEGIIKKWHAPACKNYYYVPGVEVKSVEDVHNTPQEAFAHLINKVSRKEMWEANPYVFVYDFELVK